MDKITIILSIALSVSGFACSKKATVIVQPSKSINTYVEQVIQALPYDAPYRKPSTVIVPNLKYKAEDGSIRKAVGLCKSLKNGQPVKILFDKDFWENTTDKGRLALVAHEMLHCMYQQHHTNGGLMDPVIDNSIATIKKYGLKEAIRQALD